ncbi:hypothetical protein [Actinoplanes couchii]|uniref:Uncharacterized protein n=1 Tax=Actinoplanes couchii TaxID=403638 RepID=A0ABQ3XTW9_9ACTN|nr:hypothetical protein [Actinoplanes couchii]MDR6324760.1 hypothetical protein [Actinoplanes couchii]GID61945.1 hypothetical protein Aco03nite_103490 [Actinoplanes couchii]
MFGRRDERPPLERALEAATSLKPGSWESVEALAQLSMECGGTPDAERLYQNAARAASGLRAGTYDSVRALVWLHRADRHLHS